MLGTSRHHKKGNRNLNLFEAGFDADWEIDLFGYNAHKTKALQAEAQASEAAYCDVWVSLSAEIARNYVELRGAQQRLSVIVRSVDRQKETLQMIEGLTQTGFSSSLDHKQAMEELSVLQAQKPQIEFDIYKSIHRLSILLGYVPSALLCELIEPRDLPSLPCYKPVGIPSELLRRRPDIRKVERELAAATEHVGSAIAGMFPRLSLNGFIGELGTFSANSFTWLAGPQLLMPIFNSRLIEEDIKFSKIKACEALYIYQKTVLEALEETENAIASFHFELERQVYLERAHESSRESHELTEQLYERGFKDFLEVLITNRSQLSAEDNHVQSQVQLLLSYISLYKALGGGWKCCSE